jgi:hypothetical protein
MSHASNRQKKELMESINTGANEKCDNDCIKFNIRNTSVLRALYADMMKKTDQYIDAYIYTKKNNVKTDKNKLKYTIKEFKVLTDMYNRILPEDELYNAGTEYREVQNSKTMTSPMRSPLSNMQFEGGDLEFGKRRVSKKSGHKTSKKSKTNGRKTSKPKTRKAVVKRAHRKSVKKVVVKQAVVKNALVKKAVVKKAPVTVLQIALINRPTRKSPKKVPKASKASKVHKASKTSKPRKFILKKKFNGRKSVKKSPKATKSGPSGHKKILKNLYGTLTILEKLNKAPSKDYTYREDLNRKYNEYTRISDAIVQKFNSLDKDCKRQFYVEFDEINDRLLYDQEKSGIDKKKIEKNLKQALVELQQIIDKCEESKKKSESRILLKPCKKMSVGPNTWDKITQCTSATGEKAAACARGTGSAIATGARATGSYASSCSMKVSGYCAKCAGKCAEKACKCTCRGICTNCCGGRPPSEDVTGAVAAGAAKGAAEGLSAGLKTRASKAWSKVKSAGGSLKKSVQEGATATWSGVKSGVEKTANSWYSGGNDKMARQAEKLLKEAHQNFESVNDLANTVNRIADNNRKPNTEQTRLTINEHLNTMRGFLDIINDNNEVLQTVINTKQPKDAHDEIKKAFKEITKNAENIRLLSIVCATESQMMLNGYRGPGTEETQEVINTIQKRNSVSSEGSDRSYYSANEEDEEPVEREESKGEPDEEQLHEIINILKKYKIETNVGDITDGPSQMEILGNIMEYINTHNISLSNFDQFLYDHTFDNIVGVLQYLKKYGLTLENSNRISPIARTDSISLGSQSQRSSKKSPPKLPPRPSSKLSPSTAASSDDVDAQLESLNAQLDDDENKRKPILDILSEYRRNNPDFGIRQDLSDVLSEVNELTTLLNSKDMTGDDLQIILDGNTFSNITELIDYIRNFRFEENRSNIDSFVRQIQGTLPSYNAMVRNLNTSSKEEFIVNPIDVVKISKKFQDQESAHKCLAILDNLIKYTKARNQTKTRDVNFFRALKNISKITHIDNIQIDGDSLIVYINDTRYRISPNA